jgi:methylmalonyl-CoA mutase, N-terminal domain
MKTTTKKNEWLSSHYKAATLKFPERQFLFSTMSGIDPEPVYTLEDAPPELEMPGEYPFTRGTQASMYRAKLWTMRMFAGFGSAEQTNQRFHQLLNAGQTGLSTAFDLPTLMGYDADHAFSVGEVGKCGVAVSSLADMEVLFKGIDLEKVTTSMTINSPASAIWAMYLANAEKQGFRLENLGGTIQNDILKEFIAQKEFIFPPEPF